MSGIRTLAPCDRAVGRGLTASAAQRARIEACTELAVIDEWLRRAVAASSIDDVLADRG